MKTRWYLAAFPAALIGCSGTALYGPLPAPPSGGTSGTTNAGGHTGTGGNLSNGVGGIDSGSPTGGTRSSSAAVAYGPIQVSGSGGTSGQ